MKQQMLFFIISIILKNLQMVEYLYIINNYPYLFVLIFFIQHVKLYARTFTLGFYGHVMTTRYGEIIYYHIEIRNKKTAL